LIGEGLFEWGSDDGDARSARLQHPLGVAALADGSIAIADTFNSRLRVWHGNALGTLQLDQPLDEPGGIDVMPDGRLIVADTNNHRVVLVDVVAGHVTPFGLSRAGDAVCGASHQSLRLRETVALKGFALDHAQGPPVRVRVHAEPEELLGDGPHAWTLDTLPAEFEVPLGRAGSGTLTVDIAAAVCSGELCVVRSERAVHPLAVTAEANKAQQ
jgi:hypothetical protein